MQSVRTATGRRSVISRKSAKTNQNAKKRATSRKTKKKSTKQPGMIARMRDIVARGLIPGWVFGAIFAIFVLTAASYGLIHGGHVDAAQQNIDSRFHAFVVSMGFSVDEIVLQGRKRTRKEDVLASLGVTQNNILPFFNIDDARVRVEELEWVASARVQRLWPNRLQVVLKEREPVALWQRDGTLSLIDSQGYRIIGANADSFSHLPLIVGHGANEAAPEFLALLKEYPTLAPRVRAIVRVSGRRWSLRLENGVAVELPELMPQTALDELIRIDASHRLLSREIEGIDLRLSDRIVIKLPNKKEEVLNKVGAESSDASGAGQTTTEHEA